MTERTPGDRTSGPGDIGRAGSREEPPDPGYPPSIYAEVASARGKREGDPEAGTTTYPQAVVIATIVELEIEYNPDPTDELDPVPAPKEDE